MSPEKKEAAPTRAANKIIDSRRLLYFYHVAKAGRFTAAEAVLDVAQSAMSRQIQQLEADLDVQLLERTGHGVRLTPEGEILFRHAEAILHSMASTIEEIEETRNNPVGTVTVAAPPSFMASYMAEVIFAFRERCPGVRLRAIEASTGAVFDHLASGEVDAAIVLQTGNTGRVVVQELVREPLLLIAASDHPVAAKKTVPRRDLRELDLILPASLHGSRAILSRYLGAENIPLRSHLEADSLPLLRATIRRQPACTILPRATCEAEIAAGDFIARPLRPALSRTLFIAHLRDRPISESAQIFIDTTVRLVRERAGA